MGRNHPAASCWPACCSARCSRGGAEVSFDVRGFSRDMVVMLQGFIVLFSGAMACVLAPALERLVRADAGRRGGARWMRP